MSELSPSLPGSDIVDSIVESIVDSIVDSIAESGHEQQHIEKADIVDIIAADMSNSTSRKRTFYPKWVWSPVGGWWCEPPNAKRNLGITMVGLVVVLGVVCKFSSAHERRPNTPIRPIPSEMWCKHALVDRAAGGTPKVY
ncbi:hypothetical protein T492DRAFT_873110 [Pavlovales sp. CCMP2436]|nr:hypothetical protein T492DRAFT_873110 [Pavlovales sp. CCMP2436]